MEGLILKSLDWELNFATPIDVLQHFLAQGILMSNDQVFNKNQYIRANEKAA